MNERNRKAKPFTDRDIMALEQFHLLIGEVMELIKFVRSLSGLGRKAVIQKFEDFLRDKRLSSKQIGFTERMIEYYTVKAIWM